MFGPVRSTGDPASEVAKRCRKTVTVDNFADVGKITIPIAKDGSHKICSLFR